MIEPILSLALTIEGNPGVYSLLLGSGVSRSAGVPTGYDIIAHLTEQVAKLTGAEMPVGGAVGWYRDQFGKEPEYGELLDAVAKTSPERAQLLRGYFEPSAEERENGLKQPTAAHRAIAELVELGYIRVILTTNFDRLTEQALQDRGIVPTVVASVDAIAGARPLAHSRCTIVKLHGDYLDTRLRNTTAELEEYPPELNQLLDRVIDEYGLIVAGWSADWDVALRGALERAKGRRFSTYWAVFGEPSECTRNLIQLRGALEIQIAPGGADEFFQQLAEKVRSVEELKRPHPVTAAVAVQTVKRYLPDPTHHIRLHDLLIDETERVLAATGEERFPTSGLSSTWEAYAGRARQFEALSSTLVQMLAAVGFHGQGESGAALSEVLRRLARPRTQFSSFTSVYTALQGYPVLLSLYSIGLSSIAAGDYLTLSRALVGTRIWNPHRRLEWPFTLVIEPADVFPQREAPEAIFARGRRDTPYSDVLHSAMEPVVRPYVSDQVRYDQVFDRFEYLQFLVHADARRESGQSVWGPSGRFRWSNTETCTRIAAEIETEGEQWPPLQAGLFGGSLERLRSIRGETEEVLRYQSGF